MDSVCLSERSKEDYVRWVYEDVSEPWPVILYGLMDSLYEGVRWVLCGCVKREREREGRRAGKEKRVSERRL